MSRDLVNLRPSTDLGQLDARWKRVCDAISRDEPDDEEIIKALLVALPATSRFRQSHSQTQSTTPEPSIVKWLWNDPGSQLPHMDRFFLFKTEAGESVPKWNFVTAKNQVPRWCDSHPALLWMLRCVLYHPSWPSNLLAGTRPFQIRVAWWPIIEARLREDHLDITSPHIITPSDSDKIVHQVFRELKKKKQKINVDTLWNQLADRSSPYLAGVHSTVYTYRNLEIFRNCLGRFQGEGGYLGIWLFEACLIMVTFSHLHVLTRLYANDPELLKGWKDGPGASRGDLVAVTKAVESGLTCMAKEVKEWIQLTSRALGWYRTAWRDTWLGIPESKSNLKQSLNEALQPGKTLLLLSGYEGHAVYILIQYKEEYIEIQWHNRWDADARDIHAMSADGTCFPVVARVPLTQRDEVLTWCHKATLNHTKKRDEGGFKTLYDTELLFHRVQNKVLEKGVGSHATQASCNCTVENLFTAEEAFLGPKARWIAQVMEPYIDDRRRFMDETDTRGREIVDLKPLYRSGSLGIGDTHRQDETFGGGGGGGSAGGGEDATPLLPTATHAIKLHQQRYYAKHFVRVTEPVIELMAGPELANQLIDINTTSTSMDENVNHHGRVAIRPVSTDHLFIRETHVLLVGATGTGKSVSARKVMLAWRRMQHLSDRFDAIFWIDCRNETTFSAWKKGLSVHWPAEHPWAEAWVNLWEEPSDIDESIQQRTLWVLDGFDHIHELDAEGWIGKLFQSQASLLVTSQNSEERLERFASGWRRVDVRGAGEKAKDEILSRLPAENQKRVRAQLQLWQDQYMPFYLYQLCIASACDLSRQAPVSPSPYPIYQHALVKSIKKQSQELYPGLPDKGHALAFKGYFAWKGYLLSKAAWLSWTDNRAMEDCALDLYVQKVVGETVSEAQKSYMRPSLLTDVVDPLPILQRRKKEGHFYFTHDSWQDYLCAHYLAHVLVEKPPEEREACLCQLYQMAHRDSVLMFTAEMVVDKCESHEQRRNVLVELLAPILIPSVPASMIQSSADPYLETEILIRILNVFLTNDRIKQLLPKLILDLDRAVRMPYLKKEIVFVCFEHHRVRGGTSDGQEILLSTSVGRVEKEVETASRVTTVHQVVQSARKLAVARSNPLNQVSDAIRYVVELAIAKGEPAYSGGSQTRRVCSTSGVEELSSLKQYFMLILKHADFEKINRDFRITRGGDHLLKQLINQEETTEVLWFGSPIKPLKSIAKFFKATEVKALLDQVTPLRFEPELEQFRKRASLEQAIKQGNLKTMKQLLRWWRIDLSVVHVACQAENRNSINYLYILLGEKSLDYRLCGWLPIHQAFAYGNHAICQWFIEHAPQQLREKTNCKLAYDEGRLSQETDPREIQVYDELEPIHLACVYGHKEVMKLLFDHDRTALSAVTLSDWNVAHFAASHGHVAIYKWLEEVAPDLFAMQTKEEQTPAQLALSCDYPLRAPFPEPPVTFDIPQLFHSVHPFFTLCHQTMVQYLIGDNPQRLRYQDKRGDTVLHAACRKKQKGLALFLLSKVEASNMLSAIKLANLRGETPLHLACQSYLVEVVKKLNALSCDLMQMPNKDGYFPIHIGMYNSMRTSDNYPQTLLKYFIAEYPQLLNQRSRPTSDDILAVTPAQLAAYLGNLPALEALHAQNPDLMLETTDDGRNLAHLAAQSQQLYIIAWIKKEQPGLLSAMATGGVTIYHLASLGDERACYSERGLLRECKADGSLMVEPQPQETQLLRYLLKPAEEIKITEYESGFPSLVPAIKKLNHIVPIDEEQEEHLERHRDASGRTLLHWACLGNRSSERAMWLINHFDKDMVDVSDNRGYLPIQFALDQKMATVVAKILEMRPDQLRFLDPDKLTLLAFGSPNRWGHLELCNIIIKNQGIPLEQRVIVDNRPLNAIQLAACSGSQAVLTALNEAKTTLKSKQTLDNWNLAHLAAHYGQVASLEWIAVHDWEQLSQRAEDGQSVLYIACRAGHLDFVKFLLEMRPDQLCYQDGAGNTVLHAACVQQQEGLALFLLNKVRDSDRFSLIQIKNHEDQLPIRCALDQKMAYVVVKILEMCPDQLYYQDRAGNTVLHAACVQQQWGLALFLLNKVGDSDRPPLIKIKNLENKLPIHCALDKKMTPVVVKILEMCPYQLPLLDPDKLTLLAFGSPGRRGSTKLCKIIIENQDFIPLEQRVIVDNLPLNAIQLAACSGSQAVLTALNKEEKALKSEQTSNNWNLAHLAAHYGQVTSLKWVAEHDWGQLSQRAEDGQSVLDIACRAGHLDCVRFLLEMCPDQLCYQDRAGNTVLHVACVQQQEGLALFLLNKGGDRHALSLIKIQNREDQLPIHCALDKKMASVVARILEMCPDQLRLLDSDRLCYQDRAGNTVLHVACVQQQEGLALFLLNKVGDSDPPSLIKIKNLENVLPIHCALDKKMTPVVVKILEMCPDQLRLLDPNKLTLLAFGSPGRRGSTKLCKIIIENQDFVSLEQRVIVGNLPLNAIQLAACSGSQTVLTALNKAVTTLKSEQTSNNWNLAHLAAHYGQVASLEWIAEHDRGQLSQRAKGGQSVLDIACRAGHLDCVKFLVERKIDSLTIEVSHLFQTCRGGHTGLAIWIISEHPEFLVMKTPEGRMPHELAGDVWNLELAEMLDSKHSDLKRRASEGATDSSPSRPRSSSSFFTSSASESEKQEREGGAPRTPPRHPNPRHAPRRRLGEKVFHTKDTSTGEPEEKGGGSGAPGSPPSPPNSRHEKRRKVEEGVSPLGDPSTQQSELGGRAAPPAPR